MTVSSSRPLSDLIRVLDRSVDGSALVTSVTHDSREVAPGSIFCCVRGQRADGHDFAAEAVARGAVALVVERPLPGVTIPQIEVADSRIALARLSCEFFGHPSRQLRVIGVTGTNGKTTTTQLLGSIMRTAGWTSEVFGTLSGQYTTPEAPVLQRRLAEFLSAGGRAVAMEVSSHSLSLHRVDGTRFSVGVFTNLGRDHLDFHGDMESYGAAKARLFTADFCDQAVINVDDAFGEQLARVIARDVDVIPFSRTDVSDVTISPVSHSYTWRGRRVTAPLGGSFNVMNSLAAATAAVAAGLDSDSVVAGLAAAPTVPGRFESVRAGQDFAVLVDYAHTPDGLAEVLRSVREASGAGAKVIAVFGCGGDRDKAKRPMMGEIAVSLADSVIITSDNPRSEDPRAIIDSIAAGIPDHLRHRLHGIFPDRAEAIARALRLASANDVVVIAGKGHETTQTIGTTVVPFDDRVVAREILEGRS
ncbi:MAG: UDP-N-acetylmuramoyl-L-alanyl-D-glutamate--2,6-diaminopimelate ligase [Acidimicrobiales bacterium mtb01]|nr:UDP-N-acetylmuramoyl-L-alanyl-D-glutamate--2,6-diaminopimelate ligase [Actinomycetota bacterium]TEX45932.1 MAG: UDP-N-acetylmuramoyl-L-alanyl-D-glutamate--2,6-diaminopimelate ligase [Acidimicrobiales bacterium mtb01]